MHAHRRTLIEIHICVVLWGFTAILGKLITLPALVLVWWRMLLVTLALALFPRVWRGLWAMPAHSMVTFAGIGCLIALHWVAVFGSGEVCHAPGGAPPHGAGAGGHRAHRAMDRRRAFRKT